MVKIVIPFALIALSATFVLAEVPKVFGRETSSDAILEERNYPKTIFSREDDAGLQEREPFAFLAPLIGVAARVGGRAAARAGSRAARHHVNNRNNNRRRRRDLDDELDLVDREDADELAEREMDEEDVLEREVDDDLYLD